MNTMESSKLNKHSQQRPSWDSAPLLTARAEADQLAIRECIFNMEIGVKAKTVGKKRKES
jgi:hypothetical protein